VKVQPLRKTEQEYSPIPHIFFDPILGPRTGLLATSLTNPFQAPISQHEIEEKHYSTPNKEERRLNLSRKPERNIKGSSFPTKSGRGLRNIGNTCFLNATIQCLGSIDEVNEARISTKKSMTTQDRLLLCVRELQRTETAYTPSPLIQQIPNLIRYKKGEPADAHEYLIVLINDASEPISQLFQGQMSSTVKCFICESSTIKTDNTQDVSLQIDEDANLSLQDVT